MPIAPRLLLRRGQNTSFNVICGHKLTARFENLVGAHLLKWVEYQIDTQGRAIELRYFRDIDGREVDFVIVERSGKPLAFIECKWDDMPLDSSLRYLNQRFPNVPAGR